MNISILWQSHIKTDSIARYQGKLTLNRRIWTLSICLAHVMGVPINVNCNYKCSYGGKEDFLQYIADSDVKRISEGATISYVFSFEGIFSRSQLILFGMPTVLVTRILSAHKDS